MNLLVVVLSSQLLYYLLIAQTGVVGAFHSEIHALYTLPIGGTLGAVLSMAWRHHGIRQELCYLFGIQMIISWVYPDYSLGMLLVLGFVIGYTTPLLLFLFHNQSKTSLAYGLAIAYLLGTALYSYPFEERGWIAVLLPLVSVAGLRYSAVPVPQQAQEGVFEWKAVAVMMFWIFADSALFETLSRTEGMDIWNHYTAVIVASHMVGVFWAYRQKGELLSQSYLIWGMFAFSYLLYRLEEPLLLAIVYPVVISYYNVMVFQALIRMGDIRLIGLSMIGIGWLATSAANVVALTHRIWVAEVLLGIFILIYSLYGRKQWVQNG